MPERSDFVAITKVQGDFTANILRSHLESEDIPVLLQYESVGKVIGIITDGLGEVTVLVPQSYAEVARQIIEPGDGI